MPINASTNPDIDQKYCSTPINADQWIENLWQHSATLPELNPVSGLRGFSTELTPRGKPCCIVRILEECVISNTGKQPYLTKSTITPRDTTCTKNQHFRGPSLIITWCGLLKCGQGLAAKLWRCLIYGTLKFYVHPFRGCWFLNSTPRFQYLSPLHSSPNVLHMKIILILWSP